MKQHLLRHRREVHFGEKREEGEKGSCEICGKLMAKYYLLQHMREVHLGEKEKCEICGKLMVKGSTMCIFEF